MKPQIIAVEDNELHAEKMIFFLEELGYKNLGIVDNANDCLHLISKAIPDVVLLDVNIQGNTNGIQLAEIIKQEYAIPLIYTTSLMDRETLQEAIKTQPENIVDSHKNLIDKKVKELKKTYRLTIREIDLLLFIISGHDNTHIAENLFISVNTVKYHTRNLYEKLDVKSRAELTSIFIKLD